MVPHLRRSTAWLVDPALPGWAIFGAGPLGLDCKHRFPMFIPSLTCHRSSARDDKAESGFQQEI